MNEEKVLRAASEIIKRKIAVVAQGAIGRRLRQDVLYAVMNAGLMAQCAEWLDNLADAFNDEPDRSNSGKDDGTSSEIQKSTAAGDQEIQPGASVSAGSAGSSGLGPDEPIVCGVSSAGPDSGVGSTGPQDPSGGPA